MAQDELPYLCRVPGQDTTSGFRSGVHPRGHVHPTSHPVGDDDQSQGEGRVFKNGGLLLLFLKIN